MFYQIKNVPGSICHHTDIDPGTKSIRGTTHLPVHIHLEKTGSLIHVTCATSQATASIPDRRFTCAAPA